MFKIQQLLSQQFMRFETPDPNKPDPAKPDTAKEIADLKAELAALKAAAKPPEKPENDLADKARIEREAKEKKQKDDGILESALRFDMGSAEWLKTNKSLLPDTIQGVFTQAAKETYGSAIEKVAEIQCGIVSEFFAKQENQDLLTATQKINVENFLKLTKAFKQERVKDIYESIFEPALETLRKVKKAEAEQKGGKNPDDIDDAFRDKMIKFSKTHYFKEQKNVT